MTRRCFLSAVLGLLVGSRAKASDQQKCRSFVIPGEVKVRCIGVSDYGTHYLEPECRYLFESGENPTVVFFDKRADGSLYVCGERKFSSFRKKESL